MKKTLIIIGIIIVIAAVGIGVYFGWEKSKEILIPFSPGQTTQTQDTISQSSPKLKAISKEETVAYWSESSFENIFYLSSEGKIYKTNQDSEEAISDKVLGDIKKGEFSNNGKFILVDISELGFNQMNIFSLENKSWYLFPGSVKSASFSPDSGKIAYLQSNPKGYSDLFVNNLSYLNNGVDYFVKRQTRIVSLTQEDFDLKWLNANQILLVSKPSFETNSDIWVVDLKTKNVNKFLSGKNLITNWSNSGDLGVGFQIIEKSPQFSLFDSKGTRLADFGFYTFPQKCLLISQSSIVCTVPSDQTAFNRIKFIDEYLKRAAFSNDNIIQINLADNSVKMLFSSGKDLIDAHSISFDGSKFIFINRIDSRLYSLEF